MGVSLFLLITVKNATLVSAPSNYDIDDAKEHFKLIQLWVHFKILISFWEVFQLFHEQGL